MHLIMRSILYSVSYWTTFSKCWYTVDWYFSDQNWMI